MCAKRLTRFGMTKTVRNRRLEISDLAATVVADTAE